MPLVLKLAEARFDTQAGLLVLSRAGMEVAALPVECLQSVVLHEYRGVWSITVAYTLGGPYAQDPLSVTLPPAGDSDPVTDFALFLEEYRACRRWMARVRR